MMKRLLLCVGMLTLMVSISFGATVIVGKAGQTAELGDGGIGTVSHHRADFEYNTGGAIDTVPVAGGHYINWGSHFMAFVNNSTGQDLYVTELGFPCSGWVEAGWFISIGAMPPDYNTDFSGPFTIADLSGDYPPTIYSYADLSDSGIVVPAGADVYFGYSNPGWGGHIGFNGVETWAWYNGAWDSDQNYQRTAILQIKASFEDPVASDSESFGSVKALFR